MTKLAALLSFLYLSLMVGCGNAEDDHVHTDGDSHEGDIQSMDFVMPSKGKVFFIEPADGATLTSPVRVVFGVEGVEITPAGPLVTDTGHHHILINKTPIPSGQPVPADEQHIHFGGGQTETELELAPGKYTLTMQLADGIHRSYGIGYSSSIEVTVTK